MYQGGATECSQLGYNRSVIHQRYNFYHAAVAVPHGQQVAAIAGRMEAGQSATLLCCPVSRDDAHEAHRDYGVADSGVQRDCGP